MSDLEHLDFRKISRDPGRCKTTIMTEDEEGSLTPWITLGAVDIMPVNSSRSPREWILKAHLPYGVTDNEHDSAYVLYLPLVGFETNFIRSNRVVFAAFIAGDVERIRDFRVPPQDYAPMSDPDTYMCEQCKDGPHPIISSFLPENTPKNVRLFKRMRGKRIEIYLHWLEEGEK